MNPFPQLPAVKKDSKNDAARKFFDPSYFGTALDNKFNTNLTVQTVHLQGRIHSNLLGILFLDSCFWLIFFESVNALATAVNDKNLGQFAKKYDV